MYYPVSRDVHIYSSMPAHCSSTEKYPAAKHPYSLSERYVRPPVLYYIFLVTINLSASDQVRTAGSVEYPLSLQLNRLPVLGIHPHPHISFDGLKSLPSELSP